MLLHISFPRKGKTYRVGPSPRLAGVPWNVGAWGPRTCLLRELQEGTGEHTEVPTGCDLRMRDRLEAGQGQFQLCLSAPAPYYGSGLSHSTCTALFETLLKHKGPTSLISPRKSLKAIHTPQPSLHSSVPKSYPQH